VKPIRPSAPGKSEPGNTFRRLPLLYVEDNDDNWEVVKLRMNRTYELQRAATDREACAIFEHVDQFYAVLMDIELSGSRLNGIQLTQLLRGTLPQEERPRYAQNVQVTTVPVLFVTAYGTAYSTEQLMAAGADGVLLKPVDFTRLSLALTNCHLNRATKHSS
jgi:CheY-like chemotaxis protein